MNIAAATIVALMALYVAFGLYQNLKHGSVPSRHAWLRFDRVRQPTGFWFIIGLRIIVIVAAGYTLTVMWLS